jgi:hypothetical protein
VVTQETTPGWSDGWLDLVRKDAYPLGSPEGEEYERGVVRSFLEAIGRIKAGKGANGLTLASAAAEARIVFEECMRAAGMPRP